LLTWLFNSKFGTLRCRLRGETIPSLTFG